MRKRNVQIKLWLSDVEADVLRQDAKRTGLTQSKYLRALIMKREIRERLPIDYYHLLTEISRIGNNLNQIARIANQQPDQCPDVQATLSMIQMLYKGMLDFTQHTHAHE